MDFNSVEIEKLIAPTPEEVGRGLKQWCENMQQEIDLYKGLYDPTNILSVTVLHQGDEIVVDKAWLKSQGVSKKYIKVGDKLFEDNAMITKIENIDILKHKRWWQFWKPSRIKIYTVLWLKEKEYGKL